MKSGDRFNIYDNDGNYTHYAEMRDNNFISIYTETGIYVYWANVNINEFFPVYNTNGIQKFTGKLTGENGFEIRTIDFSDRLFYSLKS